MAMTSHGTTCTSLRAPRLIELTKSSVSQPRGPQAANLTLVAPTLYLFARSWR
jgi:hypothetical protein